MSKAKLIVSLSMIILSFTLVPSIFHVEMARAQTTATMFVDPASIVNTNLGPSNNFTVTINVTDLADLYTWQIKLWFDPLIVECTDAYYPPGHVFFGMQMIPVTPEIDNTQGYVVFGASLLTPTGIDVDLGVLCAMDFHVLDIGSSNLTLDDVDSFLLDSNLDDIPAIFEEGFFSNVPTPFHDVAVTGLSVSDDRPKQNDSVTIDVTVLNNGTLTETFNVTVSYDGELIGIKTVTSLASGNSTVLYFDWNTTGVPADPYTIRAEADVVSGETKEDNNFKTVAVVVISPTATDINGDGKVNMKDVGVVARAFGAYPGHPRWDPWTDIDGDGVITLMDVALVARDFGTETA